MDHKYRTIENNSGFTLLEIVIVVMLLVLGAGVAGFSINRIMPDLRIKTATRDLKSEMNRARIRAVRENRAVIFLFDKVAEEYSYFLDNGEGGGTASDGAQNGSEPTLKNVSMPDGINLYATVFGGGESLRFDGLGRAVSGGHVYVKNKKGGYRGVTVQTIGKVNIVTSIDGSSWENIK